MTFFHFWRHFRRRHLTLKYRRTSLSIVSCFQLKTVLFCQYLFLAKLPHYFVVTLIVFANWITYNEGHQDFTHVRLALAHLKYRDETDWKKTQNKVGEKSVRIFLYLWYVSRVRGGPLWELLLRQLLLLVLQTLTWGRAHGRRCSFCRPARDTSSQPVSQISEMSSLTIPPPNSDHLSTATTILRFSIPSLQHTGICEQRPSVNSGHNFRAVIVQKVWLYLPCKSV